MVVVVVIDRVVMAAAVAGERVDSGVIALVVTVTGAVVLVAAGAAPGNIFF